MTGWWLKIYKVYTLPPVPFFWIVLIHPLCLSFSDTGPDLLWWGCHAYLSIRAPYVESFVSVPCLLLYPRFIVDKPPQGLGTGWLSTGQAQRKEDAPWGHSLQTAKVKGRGRLRGSRAWPCLLWSLKENKGLWVLGSREHSLSSSLTPLSWGLDRSLSQVFCREKNEVFRQAFMLARAQVSSWWWE